MAFATTRHVAIVGMGPRGLAVFERLVANARTAAADALHIHAFDDTLPGTGSVWRPDQSPSLLMNTVTSQITMFTDDSVDCAGPMVTGPSMYEWLAAGLGEKLLAEREPLRAQAARLGPDDYPTRALYGIYLRWVFDTVAASRPPWVMLSVHQSRVVDLVDAADRWRLTTDAGLHTLADTVVLSLGHLPGRPSGPDTELDQFARWHGLTRIPQANPADVDLAAVEPGRPVILRGLGLCFFDYLGLLTTGRGGGFHTEGSRLVYRRSGQEPTIIAGCRRGVPHQARGANQKGVSQRHRPRFLTESAITRLRTRAAVDNGIDFMRYVWPLVSQEVEFAYVQALLAEAGRPLADRDEGELVDALSGSAEDKRALLSAFGIPCDRMWDWASVLNPCARADLSSHAAFQAWLLDHLRTDVAHARQGNVDNPIKCAVDALRDLRNEVRQVVDHGVVNARSYRDHVSRWYTPMNAFLSIGPPVSRIEELLALIEAGVVCVVGPDFTVDTDSAGVFTAHSPLMPDSRHDAHALIEARLPESHLWHVEDPLIRSITDRGIVRAHRLRQPHADYRTGSIDVTARPYHVVDAEGEPHDTLFAFGVPTEGVHWATAAGVRPGVGSVILTDADAIARRVLCEQPAGSAKGAFC